MIITGVLNAIVNFLNFFFAILPDGSRLPTIAGYDIDTALQNGMGQVHFFINAIWPLQDMFYAFLVILAYLGVKILVRLFLGQRTPGT